MSKEEKINLFMGLLAIIGLLANGDKGVKFAEKVAADIATMIAIMRKT